MRTSIAPADRFAWTLLALSFLVLLAAILTSPTELVFDENRYADYPDLVGRLGLSLALLEQLNGAAGPLYAVVHFLLKPLTRLDPTAMRLANLALFLAVVALIGVSLRRLAIAEPWLGAAAILGVPMSWVLAGLALTDAPALVFVAANLALQLRGLAALARGEEPLPWFAAAGVTLGIAVLGRQTACIFAATPLLLAAIDRRLIVPVLVQGAIATVMALPLVIAWGGPVPPLDDTEFGIGPDNALIALGYLLVGLLLLTPAPNWLLRWPSLAGGLALLALNAATGLALVFPLAAIVDNFLSEGGMYAYGVACGSLLLWAGSAFLVWTVGRAWQGRNDPKLVLIHAGLVAVSLGPAFIGNVFSSRYAAMALPYLILAAAPHRAPGPATNLKIALGSALGLAALLGYYWGDLTSDLVRTI